jgi:hypothetical protein
VRTFATKLDIARVEPSSGGPAGASKPDLAGKLTLDGRKPVVKRRFLSAGRQNSVILKAACSHLFAYNGQFRVRLRAQTRSILEQVLESVG